ncbi:MAG: CAP domain-containing protein [Flavobacteriales bacterium]|nr:CAP domain-containing protein [Flavobacteriales bacterium]
MKFFETGLAKDTAKLESLNMELLQAAIFHATNLERPKKRQFKYGKNLEKGASFHSTEMEAKGFFSHINRKNKKYKTPFDRAEKFKAKYTVVGENILEEIALDYKDNSVYDSELENGVYVFYHHKNGEIVRELTYEELAVKMVDSWMKSPGHKANILSKAYTHLGVGVAIKKNPYATDDLPRVFATQLFGG